MDFFAGSGTTGHAVLESNAEEGASRRFLLMQLDESLPEHSDAAKMGLTTIAELALERILRACAALPEARTDEQREVARIERGAPARRVPARVEAEPRELVQQARHERPEDGARLDEPNEELRDERDGRDGPISSPERPTPRPPPRETEGPQPRRAAPDSGGGPGLDERTGRTGCLGRTAKKRRSR